MGLEGLTIEELEREVAEAREHCETAERHKGQLEEILKRRRHAHATIDGIDEALGLCASMLMDEELAAELRQQKFRRLQEILGEVRESPTFYRDQADRRTLPNLRSWLAEFELFRSTRRAP